MQYRREIDGLRALAILPVLFFHSGLPGLSGGYIGVDVFFVISGYLITSIIVEDVRKKSFSIVTFYERRARRILPALFIVIIATSIAFPIVTTHPDLLSSYGNSLLSVSLFVSNIWFWTQSGYFGDVSETTPMLHTWSLSVEEQFYIVFPICVALLFRFGRKPFTLFLVFCILLSLGVAEWGWRNSSVANFYLIPSRAWELLFGSVAALVYQRAWFSRVSSMNKNILSLLGLFIVMACNVYFDVTTPHPSLLTVFPVVGVVLIILFASAENAAGKLLSHKFLVGVGLISYSLYLWHQPILSLARMQFGEELSLSFILLVMPIIFCLSYISWKYVENPFRNKQTFTRARIFKFSLAGTFCVIMIGAVFSANMLIQKEIYPENMARFTLLSQLNDDSAKNMVNSECLIWNETFSADFISRFEGCANIHGKATVILGGSHGMDLYNAIARNLEGQFVVSVSRGFCRAHSMVDGSRPPHRCQYQDFLTFMDKHKNAINSVLYTQTPDRLFTKSIYEASESDVHESSINEVVAYFTKVQKKYAVPVYIVGMFPPLTTDPEFFDYSISLEEQITRYISPNAIKMSVFLERIFEKKLEASAVGFISKIDAFNIDYPQGILIDNKLIYSDKRHLNQFGEQVMGQRFIAYIKKQGLDIF
ncbi:acyltransferase family protein [Paraglaciecola sp.]|uniref:acyltransferase family protein n=1 Tax=Paraglaciecola sp. TaxID=1920173 RepID=UPI00273E8BB8|nr:acyltransferase family protein [Paraglaciecola sp.]MDP5031437.1 acyltransferase [Paraglaciecola sp.]